MVRRSVPQIRPCAHCGEEIRRKAGAFSCGTKGPLAGLAFCGRECQKAYFRTEIACRWSGCVNKRLIEGASFRRKQAKAYLCEEHTARLNKAIGTATVTSRKIDFLDGQSLDHNRITWSFLKFFIFDRANGECECCAVPMSFTRRPIEFHIDHRVPVWQGGKTASSNLQLLCIPCHRVKSSEEQKLVNKTRWSQRAGAHFQRMTHIEKDTLISELLSRIAELETAVIRSG